MGIKYESIDSRHTPIIMDQGKDVLILSCCDCGLAHVVDSKIVNGKIYLYMDRDERRTSQLRRHGNVGLMENDNILKYKMVRKPKPKKPKITKIVKDSCNKNC
jgi:hypothetical protein